MKVLSIIEARMGSTRFPGKTMKYILGRPMLELLIERLKRAKKIGEIIIATTEESKDNCIVELAKKIGVKFFRGSSENVLDRVLRAAKIYRGDIIVEMTADCPLLDPELIDKMIGIFLESDFDYVSNTLKKTFPHGLDIKIFSIKTLEEVSRLTNDPVDQEHVSLYIYKHPERYKLCNIEASPEYRYPEHRWTVDYEEDLRLVRKIFEHLYPRNPKFLTKDIIQLLREKSELIRINANCRTEPPRWGRRNV